MLPYISWLLLCGNVVGMTPLRGHRENIMAWVTSAYNHSYCNKGEWWSLYASLFPDEQIRVMASIQSWIITPWLIILFLWYCIAISPTLLGKFCNSVIKKNGSYGSNKWSQPILHQSQLITFLSDCCVMFLKGWWVPLDEVWPNKVPEAGTMINGARQGKLHLFFS